MCRKLCCETGHPGTGKTDGRAGGTIAVPDLAGDTEEADGRSAGQLTGASFAAKTAKKPKGKKDSNEALGPDENGWYDSYVLVVAEHGPDPEDNINGREDIGGIAGHHMEKNSDGGEENYKKQITPRGRHPTNTLEPLQEFVKPDENGSYTFQMRRFNVGQSRRKASSTATRINSFARKRRHKLSVTETMTVPWQAIVAIVVGMFSLIVSLLVGQLWDPEPQRRAVGHVAKGNQRRPNPHNAAGRRAPPAAAGLYGHRHQANR